MPPSPGQLYLLRSHTNDLYKVLELQEVPIAGFELFQLTAEIRFSRRFGMGSRKRRLWPVTVIIHSETRSIFAVAKVKERAFISEWETDFNGTREEFLADLRSASWGNRVRWGAVKKDAKRWVKEVAKETPDLWTQLKQGKEFFAGQADQDVSSNAPFADAEQAEITRRIQQARDYVRTSGELPEEQIPRILARLDHIEEASKRIGRKDWLMMFNGAILSLVLSDTITPSVAQHIFTLVVYGLEYFFGHGGPPPHLPGP
jgi:hypothetical protein